MNIYELGQGHYTFYKRSLQKGNTGYGKHEVLPYSWFENMKIVHNLDFKVLSDYKKYLSMMYRENWKTPDKAWTKEKHLKYNKLLVKYQIKDKKILFKKGDKL